MSIEMKIESLTDALNKLTSVVEVMIASQKPSPAAVTPVTQALAPIVQPAAPVVVASAPVLQPVAAPVVQALPVTAPSFISAPVASTPAVPFNDTKSLIVYVTEAYKTMGPEKGARISDIMAHFKYTNISDVQPEHYGQFYQAVEQLKAS